jgi:hypothetical protein
MGFPQRQAFLLASSGLVAIVAAATGCSGVAPSAIGSHSDDSGTYCGDSAACTPPLEEPDAGLDATTLAADAGSAVSEAGGVDRDAPGPTQTDASSADGGGPQPFVLRPEWNGPCVASNGAIDVNLGNSPASFVEAAWCQITGTEPSADTVSYWVNQLLTVSYVRRVDVVRTFCNQQNRNCTLAYSVPWTNDPPRTETCTHKTSRDMGAVTMFFFNCPNEPNCGLDWANTHAWGMPTPDPIYGAQPGTSGYYVPTNVGFWLRELLDARYAGMQFMMPNVYGPDVQPGTGEVANLEEALTEIDAMGGGMKVGLFNDTWAWGNAAGGTLMNPAPSLSDTNEAAQRIYTVEWQPFFQGISPSHWYTVDGQPLIYFYNAGTLTPTTGFNAVLAQMKQMCQAEFGVTPFVVVDRGFGTAPSGNGQFVWDTFANYPTTYMGTSAGVTGGLVFDNSMVKWDSLGRDMPGAIATATTRMFKGPEILSQVLGQSANANLMLIETWNDLGEGTGITRNYDYYYQGSWLTPDAFMNLIRESQCAN